MGMGLLIIYFNTYLGSYYAAKQHIKNYHFFHIFIIPIIEIGLLLGLYKVMNPVKFIDNIPSMKTE